MPASKPEGSPFDEYSSPLGERNASRAMRRLWSPRHKFNTWRRVWLAVAEAQHEVTRDWPATQGRPPLVTGEQVEALRRVVGRVTPVEGISDAEIRRAGELERELRHDVMSHVHALGEACPEARGIIHLGLTSQDVVCNADLITIESAARLIHLKIVRAVLALGEQARRTSRVPALGLTHYQPAQPVTVGRRIAQWAHDLLLAGSPPAWRAGAGLPLRGLRGATGTQAAMSALLGDPAGAERLEAAFLRRLRPGRAGSGGDDRATFDLTSQTYPRVVDTFVLADLASVAAVLHKIATDLRLLCNRKEIDEPFEDKQIGSSAMPYKRNPMRCERVCGLCRFVMNLSPNAADTAATQWLERTLDDSSNRRLSLPEAFLALDGALDLVHNVADGLIVHEAMVRRHLADELPFIASENILMACVKLGGDRQEYHERIRVHAQAAGLRVKQDGLDNDLLGRLRQDRAFWGRDRGGPLADELNWDGLLDPMRYVGRSVEQVEHFLAARLDPLRQRWGGEVAALEDDGPRV